MRMIKERHKQNDAGERTAGVSSLSEREESSAEMKGQYFLLHRQVIHGERPGARAHGHNKSVHMLVGITTCSVN